MPKILHVLSQIPAQTGSGIFFQNMVHQSQKAHYVQAALIGLPKALNCLEINGIGPLDTYKVLFETPGLPFKIPGMSDVMPYESTIFSQMTAAQLQEYQKAFEKTFEAALLNFQPDVILSHHLWFATASIAKVLETMKTQHHLYEHPSLALTSSPKLFALCHGTDLRQMALCPHLAPYVIQGCQKADSILTISPLQAPLISNLYDIAPDKIHLIGGGYDSAIFYSIKGCTPEPIAPHLNPFDNQHAIKKIELVYAGKLAQSKGLFELIQAMEQLDPIKFRLRVAGNGSGPEADALLTAISLSKADIEYVGQLNQIELASLFRSSDIFILPSYYEGLSLVAIEALACGMNLVVNHLEGLEEWLGDVINHFGKVCYVDMPQLLGPDQCIPEAKFSYCLELAKCIETSAYSLDKQKASASRDTDAIKNYYKALEEKSWIHVFARAEEVFNKEGANLSKPVSV